MFMGIIVLINDGIILINKEKNETSYDVIRKLKKILNTSKIGHSGTLDPLATGLLVIGVNRGTKILSLLNDDQKEYIASVCLGIKTDTEDITGNIIEQKDDQHLNQKELEETLNKFLGKSKQIPPKYSAKKINGKKSYEYAREGIDIKLKEQEINIKEIELLTCDNLNFKFRVVVSKGCYIRSLIQDILKEMNLIGTMSDLKRTKTDGFILDDSKKIDDFNLEDIIDLKDFCLKKYNYVVNNDKIIKNGGKINNKNYKLPILFVDDKKNPIALYDQYKEELKPIFMFNYKEE